MQLRALGLVGLFLGLSIMPLAASAADAPGCIERMMREMGWDLPEGAAFTEGEAAYDMLPSEASLAPPPQQGVIPPQCSGKIQPGSLMTGVGCTMNFIFRDSAGLYYFGTAGHCTSGVGAKYGVSGVGNQIATVVYDGGPSGGRPDFALLRIDPAFYGSIDPTLCHWGGPTGVNTAPTDGQTTYIYGYGSIYGSSQYTRPRGPGVMSDIFIATSGTWNPAIEQAYMGQAQPGDSGAPIVDGDGKAAGVHVRSHVSLVIRVDPLGKVMTRIDTAMAAASAATGLQLSLVDGTLPFSPIGPAGN